MKTAKERLERFRLDTGIGLRHGIVCRLIEQHEADVVEAIATWLENMHEYGFRSLAEYVRSGAWRKAGR